MGSQNPCRMRRPDEDHLYAVRAHFQQFSVKSTKLQTSFQHMVTHMAMVLIVGEFNIFSAPMCVEVEWDIECPHATWFQLLLFRLLDAPCWDTFMVLFEILHCRPFSSVFQWEFSHFACVTAQFV